MTWRRLNRNSMSDLACFLVRKWRTPNWYLRVHFATSVFTLNAFLRIRVKTLCAVMCAGTSLTSSKKQTEEEEMLAQQEPPNEESDPKSAQNDPENPVQGSENDADLEENEANA